MKYGLLSYVGPCALSGIFGDIAGNSRLEAQTHSSPQLASAWELSISGVPTPRQMRRMIVESDAFEVPAGQIFVVTGTAATDRDPSSDHSLTFNGIAILNSRLHSAPDHQDSGAMSVMPIPPGLVAPAGTIIDCIAKSGLGIVLGYLADE